MANMLSPTAVIVTVKNRLDQLKQTWNSKLTMQGDYKLIVVAYDDPDKCQDWIRETCNDQRVRTVVVEDQPKYHASHSRNVGAYWGIKLFPETKTLMFVDADVKPRIDFLTYTLRMLLQTGHNFIDLMECPLHTAGGAGTFVCTRRIFESLGGYNELMRHGWGWDDSDIQARMREWTKQRAAPQVISRPNQRLIGLATRKILQQTISRRPSPPPHYPPELIEVLRHNDVMRMLHNCEKGDEQYQSAQNNNSPVWDKDSPLRKSQEANRLVAEKWIREHGLRANPQGWGRGSVIISGPKNAVPEPYKAIS